MTDITMPPQKMENLEQKIQDDDVKIYHESVDLVNTLLRLKTESDAAIEEFRKIIIKLTIEIGRVTGDPAINNYKQLIIDSISNAPKNITDGYIKSIYLDCNGAYREKIILGDESFFLNNSFSEISQGETEAINEIFKFKRFWKLLKPDNRQIIKYYFIILCYYADIRYVIFNKYLRLRNLNISTHKKMFDVYDTII